MCVCVCVCSKNHKTRYGSNLGTQPFMKNPSQLRACWPIPRSKIPTETDLKCWVINSSPVGFLQQNVPFSITHLSQNVTLKKRHQQCVIKKNIFIIIILILILILIILSIIPSHTPKKIPSCHSLSVLRMFFITALHLLHTADATSHHA